MYEFISFILCDFSVPSLIGLFLWLPFVFIPMQRESQEIMGVKTELTGYTRICCSVVPWYTSGFL